MLDVTPVLRIHSTGTPVRNVISTNNTLLPEDEVGMLNRIDVIRLATSVHLLYSIDSLLDAPE